MNMPMIDDHWTNVILLEKMKNSQNLFTVGKTRLIRFFIGFDLEWKKKKIKNASKVFALSSLINSCVPTEIGNHGQRKQELCLEPLSVINPETLQRYNSGVRRRGQG